MVGLGHRGRWMFQLTCRSFDFVEAAAACDLFPHNFYEKQWLSERSIAEEFPNCAFYESYDEMLENAGLDAVIVETGADIHAEFCAKALEKSGIRCVYAPLDKRDAISILKSKTIFAKSSFF